MGSGGMLRPDQMAVEITQFTPDELQAITSTAGAAMTYTTVHAYTPAAIQHAVLNGAKGIEHGNLLDRPTAKLMAERGVFLTPTLVTKAISADGPISQTIPKPKRDKYRMLLASGLEAIRIATEEGVDICFGTDLLGAVGVFQSREFGIRAEVQSTAQVLQSATVTPARMMGVVDKVGQIREGLSADLLVLIHNPLEDVTVLERGESELLAVFKEGKPCFSSLEEVKGVLD